MTKTREVAIVIGSGVAGALSAISLSKCFRKVIILDRDTPLETGVRRGIAHGEHVHNVLYRGNQIIEQLIPHFFDGIPDHCPEIEVAHDQLLITPLGAAIRYPSGLKIRGYSRALLDRRLLMELSKVANIEVLYGHIVAGLAIDRKRHSRSRTYGVRVKVQDQNEFLIRGELVVDASGRNSSLPGWLEPFGYARPPIKRVRTNEGYATQVFRLNGAEPDWRQYGLLRIPGLRERGAYALSIENGKWIVSLVGDENDDLPRNFRMFKEWAKKLDDTEVSKLLEHAEPIGRTHVFSGLHSMCRFYDEVLDWPEGLVAVGDALCSFNPIFGQGITTAAETVLKLTEVLDRNEIENFERTFHQEALEILRSPWLYSMRDEMREELRAMDRVARDRVIQYRLFALKQIMEAIVHSREAHYFLFEIQNLMRPVDELFRPLTVLKWMRMNRRNRERFSSQSPTYKTAA